MNINEIVKGVFQSGYLGFYAFKKCSGQGIMTEGLSLILDVYFKTLNLHRLEANIQPANSNKYRLLSSDIAIIGPSSVSIHEAFKTNWL